MACHIAVPAWHQHHGGARIKGGMHQADHARDVEHGYHAQGHVFRGAIAPDAGSHRVVHDSAVGVHAALGQAGGAAGVGENRQIVGRGGDGRQGLPMRDLHEARPGVHLPTGQQRQLALRAQPLAPGGGHFFGGQCSRIKHIGELRHHHVRQLLLRRQGCAGLRQIGRQVGGGHGHFHVGVGDVVLQLLCFVHGVDRHHHRIQPQDGKVRDHQLRAVLHIEHHPVTLAHTQPCQLPSQLLTSRLEFAVGPAPAHEDQRGFVGVAHLADHHIGPKRCGGRTQVRGQARGPDCGVAGHGTGLLWVPSILISLVLHLGHPPVTAGTPTGNCALL